MKIKCGRREFDITSEDIIVYNNYCYQVITKSYLSGYTRALPSIAKVKAEKMIRDGLLVVSSKNDRLTYYKLKEAGE